MRTKLIPLLKNTRGFSLLEVLIALTITGVITAAVMRTYVTQHRNYMVQEDITSVQQSARAALDEIGRHVRIAGNNLPLGLQALVPVNADPDTLTVIYRIDDCDTYLDSTMSMAGAALICATDVSCFQVGGWAYIFEPDSGGGEWFQVSNVNTGSRRLEHASAPLTKSYNKDAIVLTMEEIMFYVDDASDTAHPALMIALPGQTPQVYADNVSNLQFRYRLQNEVVVDSPVLIEDVREVLISITGRSATADIENTGNPYRTRTYSSTINLRNVGL